MSTILPMARMSQFTRKPDEVTESKHPYTVIFSHTKEKGVWLKPEIFKSIQQTDVWKEICQEWYELNDTETKQVVSEGKAMMQSGDYSSAVNFS